MTGYSDPDDSDLAWTSRFEAPIRRLRFTDKGEVIEESTFATEAEQQGFRESQMPLGIASGERPIEDLPLFGHDCMENAVPYTSDGALGHGWECGRCGKFLQAG